MGSTTLSLISNNHICICLSSLVRLVCHFPFTFYQILSILPGPAVTILEIRVVVSLYMTAYLPFVCHYDQDSS